MIDSVRFAGLGVRIIAVLIDSLIVLPFYALFYWALPGQWTADVALVLLLCAAYTLFFTSSWQATPGMRAMGVKAVGQDLLPLSHFHAFMWCMLSLVGMAIVFIPIIVLAVRFDLYAIQQLVGEMALYGATGARMQQLENLLGMSFDAFRSWVMISWCVSMVLMLAWALSIVFSRQKSGPHNWAAKVRFIVTTPAQTATPEAGGGN